MRRVLIVSPHFPPVNTPDMHRVRTALPYLRDCGWEATVLAVEPNAVERARDPLLLRTVPDEVAVERVRAWSPRVTRRLGFGSLALRARGALRKRGDRLLAQRHFDCVLFSTTEFPLLTLGLRWRARQGVPFVADWQDPWRTDYYARTRTPPPGGPLKFAFAQWLARRGEPAVVRGAAKIVSVSGEYINQLAARYPDWDPTRATVLPFGAPERDFELLPELAVAPAATGEPLGREVWLYAGRGGADLHPAARVLFAAIRAERAVNPAPWQNRRICFLGTSYAARGTPSGFTLLAAAYGLGDLVHEVPQRAPYFATLAALQSAARLLLLGSDDPGYTASKLAPYLLARRPLLAVLHERCEAAALLRGVRGAQVVTFSSAGPADAAAERLRTGGWLQSPAPAVPELDGSFFATRTARAMTLALAAVLNAAAEERPARAKTVASGR